MLTANMSLSPLVSVIIPVYNVNSYLPAALDSVLAQTYQCIEVLIIDDGSTDGSSEICNDYGLKDGRIKVFHQDNRGLSAARNVGLENAKGSVLAFLDSDDIYQPTFISSMLKEMHQNDVDIVVCKYADFNDENIQNVGKAFKRMPNIEQGLYNGNESLRAYARGSLNSVVWNKLYKKRLWEGIRFPVGHVLEDVSVFYRILSLCNKVYVLDEILYLRRIRPDSITSTASASYYYDYVTSLLQFENFIIENMPAIFDDGHLARIRILRLNQLISCYLSKLRNNNERNTCLSFNNLRKQIIEASSGIRLNDISSRTKTAYFTILLFPWLIKIAYPIYHRLKRCGFMIL